MDFVQKQLFKHQVNKLQSSLGLDPETGRHHSRTTPLENYFFGEDHHSNGHGDQQDSHTQDLDHPEPWTTTADKAIAAFDAQPKNYPSCFPLFFIDHSILSDLARPPVNHARIQYIAISCAALFNVAVQAFLVAVHRPRAWVDLVISIPAFCAIFLFQLAAYEVAFTGAYRAPSVLQLYYIFACIFSKIILSLYAFLGFGIFHGWARLSNIQGTHSTTYRILTIVEASIWTALVVYSTWVVIAYARFRKKRVSGLSQAARASALSNLPHPHQATGRTAAYGEQTKSAASGTANNRSIPSDRAKIEEIKNKYRTGG